MSDLKDKLGSLKLPSAGSIENASQIPSAVLSVLNEQIDNEIGSAQLYFGMAIWLTQKGYEKTANKFLDYGKEERGHMDRIQEHIKKRNAKFVSGMVPGVTPDYKDLKDLLSSALKHEIEVTKQWNNIASIAYKNNDFTTLFFTRWFLDEQIEEENKFRDILLLMNKGMPDFDIETYWGQGITPCECKSI